MQWTSEAANAGVVDENIKSAQGLLDVGGCGFDGAQVCNIAFEWLGSAPGFRNGVGGGLQMLLGAPAKDRRGPHGCNFGGNGSADAAASPGNDGNLASQNGIIALFRGFHGDPPAIFVMLAMHNRNGANSHLNKKGRKSRRKCACLS